MYHTNTIPTSYMYDTFKIVTKFALLPNLLTRYFLTVLGTCATFSATAPLAQTEKGGARLGGTKVKNYGAVAVARTKFSTEILINFNFFDD